MPPRRSTRKRKIDSSKETNVERNKNEAGTNPSPMKKRKAPKKEETLNDLETLNDQEDWQSASSIYDFSVKDIDGKETSLDKYRGHVCIIVNVASRCGHTKSNYEQFVELHSKYAEDKGLNILAFPCNQFGGQEPGDSQKIKEFVKKRNVKFDMYEKINVNGKNAHPLWKYIKSKISGPKGNDIDWNFTKFIIDKDGQVIERHKPSVKPLQLVKSLEEIW